MSPPPRRSSPRRRLLLIAASVVGALLVLEGALRLRFYLQHGTFSRIHEFARDEVTGLPIPVPGRQTSAIRIDSRGFRNPELDVPKPSGRVRIAFLGASTTFCAEASSNEATWPALVAHDLAAAHPGVSIDYVNAGVAGYILDHVERRLESSVKPLEPDVIVLYEATNDFTRDTRAIAKRQGVYVEHADREDGLARLSLLWHYVEKNVLVRRRVEAATSSQGRVRLDLPSLESAYRARFARLIANARRVAPVVAVVTFSQRARRGLTPEQLREACFTHFYYMPYIDAEGVVAGFEAYNRAIRAAARDNDAILIEGEDDIPPDEAHFADSVHFTDRGCRTQADRVLHGLGSAPAFQALFAR